MTNRRQFLTTLGKVFGSGGLLLPWAGKGALALPTDLGKAAQVPVTPAQLPFSREALLLREIRRQLHKNQLAEYSRARCEEWRSLMVDHYKPIARKIETRPAATATWTDCVELAEIISHGGGVGPRIPPARRRHHRAIAASASE
jgi:hypothetical protein